MTLKKIFSFVYKWSDVIAILIILRFERRIICTSYLYIVVFVCLAIFFTIYSKRVMKSDNFIIRGIKTTGVLCIVIICVLKVITISFNPKEETYIIPISDYGFFFRHHGGGVIYYNFKGRNCTFHRDMHTHGDDKIVKEKYNIKLTVQEVIPSLYKIKYVKVVEKK